MFKKIIDKLTPKPPPKPPTFNPSQRKLQRARNELSKNFSREIERKKTREKMSKNPTDEFIKKKLEIQKKKRDNEKVKKLISNFETRLKMEPIDEKQDFPLDNSESEKFRVS